MDSTLPKKSPAAEAAQRAAQRQQQQRAESERKRADAERKREESTQVKKQKLTAAKKETRSGRIDNPYHKPYGTGVVSPPGNKSPQSWDYRSTTEAVVRKYKKPNLDKQPMGLNATFSAKTDDTKDAGMAQNPYESTRYVIPAEREPMDRADGVEVGYDKNVAAADKNMQLKRRKALKLAQMYRIDEDGGLGGDSGLGAGVSPMPGSFGGSSGSTATRITGNPDGTGNYMLKGKTNKMKTLKTFKNEMGTLNKPFYNFGEEAELIEATVTKKDYPWGKMVTVHDGANQSFPLHPEHQKKIKDLKPGEKTTFVDETKAHVTAHRENGTIHLKNKHTNRGVSVPYTHFSEEAEQVDEISTKDDYKVGDHEEVMSEGELDGGSMSGKANGTLEDGSVDSAKTRLMGKVKKVQEMAVRDAAGKKHTINNVEIRMADGTLKSLPPGKSGSSGGGGK